VDKEKMKIGHWIGLVLLR